MKPLILDHSQYDNIGIFLRDYRLALRQIKGKMFTQQAITEMVGLSSPQYLSNIERCVSPPSHSFTIELAKIYGIPREVLYDVFSAHSRRELADVFLRRKSGGKRNE